MTLPLQWTTSSLRAWIYGAGAPRGNEGVYLRKYVGHNEEVLRYFAGHRDDLLVMDLSRGDGGQELCSFLGRDVPAVPFPHANEAQGRAVAMKGIF